MDATHLVLNKCDAATEPDEGERGGWRGANVEFSGRHHTNDGRTDGKLPKSQNKTITITLKYTGQNGPGRVGWVGLGLGPQFTLTRPVLQP